MARWGIDAHMGRLFGLANQIVLAALTAGLMLLIGYGCGYWLSTSLTRCPSPGLPGQANSRGPDRCAPRGPGDGVHRRVARRRAVSAMAAASALGGVRGVVARERRQAGRGPVERGAQLVHVLARVLRPGQAGGGRPHGGNSPRGLGRTGGACRTGRSSRRSSACRDRVAGS
ncbi:MULTISPECIES: hypothetical protein [unclassified Nonomuraea]|uniref:hypothetical protein n=1 Tax=unclassified Nonomuraea TaxID=2593643 RepID=UPI003409A723